jgi:hypothetical protein
MAWDEEKQARLDTLRAAELTGTLDEVGKAELSALIESIEVEERKRLAPALARMQAEQAALRQQIQASEAENEQLAALAVQMEQLLADGQRMLRDLQRRHQALRAEYQRVTGKPLSVAT